MKKYKDVRLGRRGMLCGVAAAAVSAAALTPDPASAVPTETRAEVTPTDPRQLPDTAAAHGLRPAGDAVRAYLGPLREATVLEGRWTIEAVHDVRLGAVPLVLSFGGERFAVELLRRSPGGAAPVASTGSIAVYLSNRGDGTRASSESFGLGAMALARALEARERAGAEAPELLSHGERRARHPMGLFHIPVGQ